MFRTALALLASTALVAAQPASDAVAGEAQATPTPSSSPEVQPSPEPEASPSPSPAETPSVEATPAPAAEASPAPAESPAATEELPTTAPVTPGEDIIPLPEAGAPLDTDDIVPVAPVDSGVSSDASFVDPNAFVTDELPPAPPAGIGAVESELERQRKLRVRYRDVRVQAEKDPQVVEMKERSQKATSPEGRRAALREYYRLVSQKITALDASLKDMSKALEEAYIRRMAQTRIEPTIPLEPPPTPAPLN